MRCTRIWAFALAALAVTLFPGTGILADSAQLAANTNTNVNVATPQPPTGIVVDIAKLKAMTDELAFKELVKIAGAPLNVEAMAASRYIVDRLTPTKQQAVKFEKMMLAHWQKTQPGWYVAITDEMRETDGTKTIGRVYELVNAAGEYDSIDDDQNEGNQLAVIDLKNVEVVILPENSRSKMVLSGIYATVTANGYQQVAAHQPCTEYEQHERYTTWIIKQQTEALAKLKSKSKVVARINLNGKRNVVLN